MRTLLSGLAFAVLALAADRPVEVLFITGQSDTQYHDWRVSTPHLRQILERTGRFEVKVCESPATLTPAALAGVDVLILNYTGPRWGAAAEQAVEEFIRSGQGMVGVHGVNYGPLIGTELQPDGKWKLVEPWPAFPEMLGMTWAPADIGHARRHVFKVKVVDRTHPIGRALPPEFEADDELYHKMALKPTARVIASAYDDPATGGTGKDEPVLWTVPFGSGRVVYFSLGHDRKAMSMPGFVEAFVASVEWAARSR
ncbi:MAG TPA: ThuA domain-containing protein [Bryobacteraceae bacterium]|nr:ThuA domain-containing protein [Bryobacteraceae bacterium]HOL71926.1 ThuA domain-containing protein [Bryobacteraceae bacterium]HOQ45292.1 ThuA domain-containing protein [Bryobacteraceae bacterium]HPQ13643.1 ThuA domain-containing protein [Bryobacteraceae bacterium]HPU71396.1 ThuA domain-containing protein [Bryobacteraceae bacterium]